MKTKQALINAFENRVFKKDYVDIFRCINMIDEKQIWMSPEHGVPSIGNLILHISGNARQLILSGIGGLKDNREEDQEFKLQRRTRKSELVFLLENLKANLLETIKKMDEKQLFERKVIRNLETSNFSAIVHVMEHFSYHTGQITTLTKWLTNKQIKYSNKHDLNLHLN